MQFSYLLLKLGMSALVIKLLLIIKLRIGEVAQPRELDYPSAGWTSAQLRQDDPGLMAAREPQRVCQVSLRAWPTPTFRNRGVSWLGQTQS